MRIIKRGEFEISHGFAYTSANYTCAFAALLGFYTVISNPRIYRWVQKIKSWNLNPGVRQIAPRI